MKSSADGAPNLKGNADLLVQMFSAIHSLLVGTICAASLLVYWPSFAECHRPLRWWLLVLVMLPWGQLPARAALLLGLRQVERAGGGAEASASSFTLAAAWQSEKLLGLGQYACGVLVLYWWMDAESCPLCPGMRTAVAAAMAIYALRAEAKMVLFLRAFPQSLGGGEGARAAPAGAALPDRGSRRGELLHVEVACGASTTPTPTAAM